MYLNRAILGLHTKMVNMEALWRDFLRPPICNTFFFIVFFSVGQIVRSLLEAEKWELALEIATKSGLPRNSVLAAWGKACLKAGCFKEARRKFALCFKNTAVCVEVDELEYGKEASEFNFVNR